MKQGKIDIFVFADWKGLDQLKLMGVLSAHFAKGKKAFSFEYDSEWIKTESQRLIDPDIQFFSGVQFPNQKENFGINIPVGQWHTIEVLEAGTVIFECKDGPYRPLDGSDMMFLGL